MEKRKIACAFLSGFILFGSTVSIAADSAKKNSTVQENKERLIKTKSCPGCNLAGVNLNRADLAGADLQGADLSHAKFFLANLAGANLQKARLQGAGFGGADLAKANFKGADLRDVSLDGAYYKGAYFDKDFLAFLKKEKISADEEIKAELEEITEPAADVEKPPLSEQAVEPPVVQMDDEKVEAPTSVPAPAAKEPEAAQRAKQIVEDQGTVVSGVPDATEVPQDTEEGKSAEPPDTATISGEAPPVKTIQPMQEIVIAEQVTAEDTSETAKETEIVAASAPQTDVTKEQAAASKDEQPLASIDPSGTKTSSQQPMDKEKMENLARLVKTKKCFSCDLSGMDLSGMRLTQADLEKADLSGCNLEGAILDGANLKGISLQHANLKKASLKNADLYKADLTGADLSGADMKKALVDEAVFTDAVGVSEDFLKRKN